MRKIARVDCNQKIIVKGLRKYGCSVVSTHQLGGGFPDLVVGFQNRNYLVEVKDGEKPPSQKRLTPCEKEFFDNWQGQAIVIKSLEDVERFFCDLLK